MIFTPFPPQIAERSAEAARLSRMGKPLRDHVIAQVAAYRTEDGAVRPAYDLYAPMHPAGAEPGLADLSCRLRWHPNDTHSYDTNATNFTPAAEILKAAGPWANPAAAWIRQGDAQGFLLTQNEAEMEVRLADLEEGAEVFRHVLRLRGMGGETPPAALLIVGMGGRDELYAAGSLEAMAEAMAERHHLFDLGRGSAEDRLDRLAEIGGERGWRVFRQALPEIEAFQSDFQERAARREDDAPTP